MDQDIESVLGLTEGQKLVRLLWEDVAPGDVFPDLATSARERRQFIRSMFACIEGTLWSFKQEALGQHEGGAASFTHSELALLAELLPTVATNGTVQETPANIRFESNVRFTFRCHARAYAYEDVLDVSDHRWNLLLRSAQVRNRLMHPKGLESMQISDEELLAARSSLKWFARSVSLGQLGGSAWHSVRAAAAIEDPQQAKRAASIILEKMNELRNLIMSET
jgi:hypothetical protein